MGTRRIEPDRAISALSGTRAGVSRSRRLTTCGTPRFGTRQRDGDYLAFTVFGEGPTDLAIPQSRFPIDLMWEWPHLATFMETLGRLARVIAWDVRGHGAWDPILYTAASSTEDFADDMRAVLGAADSERASLLEMGSGGASCPLYAATYPERVQSLILVHVRRSYPELLGLSALQRKRLAMRLRSPERLQFENPRAAHDPVVQRWWGHAVRLEHSPDQMARHVAAVANGSEMGSVLPTLRIPTLVLHRRDNRVWDVESSRAAAGLIPNARFVELPGAENDIFLGETAPVLAEIERFLAEPGVEVEHDRVLSTVLFTDMVASTEQLAARVTRHGGVSLTTTITWWIGSSPSIADALSKQLGDGILATFDGPARAVRCASALLEAAPRQGHHLPRRFAYRRNRTPTHPMSRGSRCISRVASPHSPIRTRSSSPARSSTSPRGRDLQFDPAVNTNSKACPAPGQHSLPRLDTRAHRTA